MVRVSIYVVVSWYVYYYIGCLVLVVMNFCQVINDLVEIYIDKIGKLYFYYCFLVFDVQVQVNV